MNFIILYGISYIMDLIFGDPHWFYHPVRFIGKIIDILEKILYHKRFKKICGVVLVILTIIIIFILTYYIAKISIYLQIFFLYTTLATKSLADEGYRVALILVSGDMERAKKELSYLVSRDTQDMDIVQIVRSVVETISENTSDGVVAPMLYAFIGALFTYNGVNLALPFAFTYKTINTLDSMLGYKNEKYIDFGYFAAKLDDLVNLVPSRLTGGLIVPISAFILRYNYKGAIKIFWRDRNKHISPNSGQPESAYAGALGIQFGGKTIYFGKIHEKERVGDKVKEFEIGDIKKSIRILYISSWISFLICTIFYLIMEGLL